MNIFQLIFKQMRQRALSTWLTIFTVLLGVGLAIGVMILRRESGSLFGQSDFGYEMIIGPPAGSPLQLTLNTVYHLDASAGNIPYSLYERMLHERQFQQYVKWAIPFMVGDSYKGHRIVGTSPQMFGFDNDGKPVTHIDEQGNRVPEVPFQYRLDKSYKLAEGRVFAPKKFEAVLGSEVAKQYHMTLYDPKLTQKENEARGAVFQATHGMPGPGQTPDIHKPKWHVVGILEPTHTANDRCLYIPVISLYAIAEHDEGLLAQKMLTTHFNPSEASQADILAWLKKNGFDPGTMANELRAKVGLPPLPKKPEPPGAAPDQDPDAYHFDANGDIVPDLPPSAWEISAILVKTRSDFGANSLKYYMRTAVPEAAAVNPATEMRNFFGTFFEPVTTLLLVISLLVTIVAAVGILVGIYNSVSARMREIAILRALGATRRRVLTLICLEAGFVGVIGGVAGLIVGHLAGAVESAFFNARYGQGINWISIGWHQPWYANEVLYLVLVVVIALLAGLVPALKAYRTPVATNLVAG